MLLTEEVNYLQGKVETVFNESLGSEEKQYFIEGIFSTPNVRNRNGRLYPLKLWEKCVAEYQKEINESTINSYGELEHPDRTYVLPENAVIQMEKLYMKENKVYGRARVLNVPKSQELRERIEKGKRIGVSSRGTGTLNESTKVVEEFNLITYDVVKNPSDYNANLNGCSGKDCTISENLITEEQELDLKQIEDRVISKVSDYLKNYGLVNENKDEQIKIFNDSFREIKKEIETLKNNSKINEEETIESVKTECKKKIAELEEKIKQSEKKIVESVSNYINNISITESKSQEDVFKDLSKKLKYKYN